MMKKFTLFLIGAVCAISLNANDGDVVVKFNGETRNLSQEERNRQMVLKFYDEVFNKHDLGKATEVLDENLIQHNPGVADGKKGFIERLTPIFQKLPNRGSKIIRSAAQGDLVWVHVHSTEGPGDRGRAIMDIFRIKDGKIAEHWDVVQAIPEEAKNNNTMF